MQSLYFYILYGIVRGGGRSFYSTRLKTALLDRKILIWEREVCVFKANFLAVQNKKQNKTKQKHTFDTQLETVSFLVVNS